MNVNAPLSTILYNTPPTSTMGATSRKKNAILPRRGSAKIFAIRYCAWSRQPNSL